MTSSELEIGAQTRAAGHVQAAVDPVSNALTSLAREIDGSIDGFQGASGSAFADAVTRWFEVGGRVPALLTATPSD